MNSSHGHAEDNSRISLREGKAPYTIGAEMIRVGDDLVCIVTGGTHAHTGAVSFAELGIAVHPVTGAKLKRDDGPVVRTLIGEGHKDALPAEMYAKALCKRYDVNVVCTAGIHVDGATKDEIAIMMENVTRLLEKLLTLEI